MRRHFIFAVTLFLASAAAGAGAEPVTVDEYIGLHCEDVIPAWVREKHLENAPFDEALDASRCDCRFARKPFSLVTVVCGATEDSQRHETPRGKTTAIAGLEDGAHKELSRGDLLVSFTDKDTPCFVVIHADPKDPTSEAKAIALGRDIAKALTPEVVAKRRTAEAILWAQDKTGSKAAAALKAWPKEAEAMKEFVTFAPGFPKVMDHAENADWPQGKKSLLLGFCPNFEGSRLVKSLKGALPGVTWIRVPAAGTVASCPTPKGYRNGGYLVTKQARLGKQTLSVVALNADTLPPSAKGPPVAALVYAFLRDGAGAMVASFHEDVISRDPVTKFKLKPEADGLTVETIVRVTSFDTCTDKDTQTITTRLTVDGEKIKGETTIGPHPPCGCCQGE